MKKVMLTPRENLSLYLSGKTPCWLPVSGWGQGDMCSFRPRQIPDNFATQLVTDGGGPMTYESNVKAGWFGLKWVFVPQVGGATVKPGKPMLEDMNDWESTLQWPDLDAIDWEEMGRINRDYLDTPQFRQLCILDGFWERLISLMDVAGAAMALIDEDQEEALHAFFDRYADFLIEYIRRVRQVCPIDGVLIHDDWGTQNGPFFSRETAETMLLPYLKRVVDFIHSQGMYYEQHSCGNCTKLAPVYVAAGVDLWQPQPMNDFAALLEIARGTRLHIAMAQSVGPEVPEPEARQAARDWFARYGRENVTFASRQNHPAFLDELRKVSMAAFAR